jgi:hypothetical protein
MKSINSRIVGADDFRLLCHKDAKGNSEGGKGEKRERLEGREM